MSARFWRWYQGLGQTEDLAPSEARYVRALNGTILIVVLLLWSQLPIVVYLLPTTRYLLPGLLLFPVAWQLAPLLNHLGKYTAARLFFSLSSIAFIAFNAAVLGPGVENHFFMMTVFVTAFIIYPPRQFKLIILVAVLAGVSLVSLELYYNVYGRLVGFPPEIILLSRWSSMLTLFMVFLFVSLYHYRVVVNAENRLEREHQVSEGLLLNILPAEIALRLKTSREPIADRIEGASILFADLTGFTVLASRIPPRRVVEILNTLFSKFDQLCHSRGLEKIKTIGDAYMVAGGVPTAAESHYAAVADCALEMIAFIKSDPIPEAPGLSVRIGIHTGPVVAGVICERKFAYDLWGDTVNTASRMESHGLPNRIHVSAEFYERTKDRYLYEPRGALSIKGKGMMETYLLEGKRQPARSDGYLRARTPSAP
jgi:adenylate cyclase